MLKAADTKEQSVEEDETNEEDEEDDYATFLDNLKHSSPAKLSQLAILAKFVVEQSIPLQKVGLSV